jgi:nitroimidazol reductase NimA-like FMN-containing flavoprotein (pyridoxamine 5'-phosphate oxidase superfamily)
MLREIPEAECFELLRRNRIGRIAMRDGDSAYLVPISYACGDRVLYGHAAPGRKVQLLREWPRVAFQVDEIRNPATWKSVMVRGTWHEIHDRNEADSARLHLVNAFQGSLMSLTAGHGHRTTLTDAVLFLISIEEITGRAENL